MADFNAGIKAAQSAIDFQEYRVSFADAGELSKTLAQNDAAEKARKEMQVADAEKTKQFNASLVQMQEANKMLQGSLDKAVAQGNEAMNHSKELELKLSEALNQTGQGVMPGYAKTIILVLAVLVIILIVALLFR